MTAVSVIPARRAARIPPVDALRRVQSGSAPPRASLRRLAPVSLFLLAGGLCWWLGARLDTGGSERLMLGLASALLFAAAVFSGSWVLIRGLVRAVRPALRKGWGGHGLLAAKSMAATQARSRLATLIMGSSVALAVVAFTVLSIVETNFSEQMKREFLTPMTASSRRLTASTLPLSVAREIARDPSVAVAVAWGSPFSLDWLNHGEFRVDSEWMQRRRQVRVPVPGGIWEIPTEMPSIQVQPVDLDGLARLGVLGDLDPAEVKGVVVLTEQAARRMGVNAGDVLQLYDSAEDQGFVSRLTDPKANVVSVTVASVIREPLGPFWVGNEAILIDWDTLPLKPQYQIVNLMMIEPIPGGEGAVEVLLAGLAARRLRRDHAGRCLDHREELCQERRPPSGDGPPLLGRGEVGGSSGSHAQRARKLGRP